jgi:hypothetical protein
MERSGEDVKVGGEESDRFEREVCLHGLNKKYF